MAHEDINYRHDGAATSGIPESQPGRGERSEGSRIWKGRQVARLAVAFDACFQDEGRPWRGGGLHSKQVSR